MVIMNHFLDQLKDARYSDGYRYLSVDQSIQVISKTQNLESHQRGICQMGLTKITGHHKLLGMHNS